MCHLGALRSAAVRGFRQCDACLRSAARPCCKRTLKRRAMPSEPLIGGAAAAPVKDVTTANFHGRGRRRLVRNRRSSSISGRRGAALASNSGRSSKKRCAQPTARCAWSSSTSTRTPKSRSRCASSRSRRSMPSRTAGRSTALSARCRKARSSSSSSASAAARRTFAGRRGDGDGERGAATGRPRQRRRRSFRRSCSASPEMSRRSPGWRAR